MNNIDKAIQAIKDTAEAEIKKLRAMQEEEMSHIYWFIGAGGVIHTGDRRLSTYIYENHLRMGNVYRTKQEARAARDQQQAMVRITHEIALCNREQGWVLNWSGGRHNNFCLYYSHMKGELITNSMAITQIVPNCIHGSKETMQHILDNHSDDYRLALGFPARGE